MSNPFHDAMDDRLRGRYVRAISNQGRTYRGWVEKIHHQQRHLLLLDATLLEEGNREEVGSTVVSQAVEIAVLEDEPRVRRVALEDIVDAPYHEREFEESANRGYVADVRDTGYVGSYPVVREVDGQYEIVEGHKRIWACRQAGLEAHPVEIVDVDDWAAARRFVADHYPDPGQVTDDGVRSGCYDGEDLRASLETLVERFGERVRELDRVRFNADRLDVELFGEGQLEADDEEGDSETESEVLQCDEEDCEFTTDSSRGLSIHQARVHEGDDGEQDEEEQDDAVDSEDSEEIWCGICGAGPFDSMNGLSGHHAGAGHDGVTRPVEGPDGGAEDDGDESEPTAASTEDAVADVDTEWLPEDEGEKVEWSDYSADNAGNGNQCQNCGAHVPKKFTRVFEPESEGGPRVCPSCTDMVREADGTIREARSTTGVERSA